MGRSTGHNGHLIVSRGSWPTVGATLSSVAVVLSILFVGACAQELRTSSLTAITFNYSEGYSILRVNGEWAGAGANSVEPGDVTGGGGICCIDISTGAKTATVEVQTGIDKKYVTEARIEQPWPELPHYAAVHILPGRKIIISVTATSPAPRTDLLDEALGAMGIKDYTIEAPYAWDSGPEKQL